ncbi:MAG TPA: hypothetical protein VFO85_12430, partial [Vicinamibacteria bacterium]|nr:hypothetical protein [Vicinamibacteria bacterium]
RAHLWAWVAVGLLLITLRPVPYALQFLAGIGFPLLALGALGLARFPPAATLGALAVLASTTAAALGRMGDPARPGFVPAATLSAARALRPACAPGDLLLAPPDVGLLTLAYSSCIPYVSHPAMSGYEERVAAVQAFYGERDARRRAAFLAQVCPAVLVLPGPAGGYALHRRRGPCTAADSGFPTADAP